MILSSFMILSSIMYEQWPIHYAWVAVEDR